MLKILTTTLALGFATSAFAEDAWMSIPVPAPMPQAEQSGQAEVNGISSSSSYDDCPVDN